MEESFCCFVFGKLWLPLEIWNVCDDILIDEPTIYNQTERWFRSFTADQPGIQTAGSTF